jgi:hypothetical protein
VNRTSLIEKFEKHLPGIGSKGWTGKKELATFLAWYFKYSLTENFDSTGIEMYLPQLTAEAMLVFKNSNDRGVDALRTKYLDKVRLFSFPDILDIQEDSYRLLICNRVASLMAEVTGVKRLAVEIEQYLLAQDNALEQVLQRFNMQVWRKGLWNYMRTKPTGRGVIGKFGKTKLGLFVVGPSITVSFVNLDQMPNSKGFAVSFNAEAGDSTGLKTALSSIQTTLGSATGMIEDVIQAWPKERSTQAEMFVDALRA